MCIHARLTRSINLGGVLAREGTAAVGSPATIRVNDDLATSQTSISMRSSNHKPAHDDNNNAHEELGMCGTVYT